MAIFEWVDDFVSFRIPTAQVAHYNRRQQQQQDTVINDGRTQKGGHLWFKGANWPDGTTEEFDNMSTAASTPSKSSPRSVTHHIGRAIHLLIRAY